MDVDYMLMLDSPVCLPVLTRVVQERDRGTWVLNQTQFCARRPVRRCFGFWNPDLVRCLKTQRDARLFRECFSLTSNIVLDELILSKWLDLHGTHPNQLLS